jgi:hypothetical protein
MPVIYTPVSENSSAPYLLVAPEPGGISVVMMLLVPISCLRLIAKL